MSAPGVLRRAVTTMLTAAVLAAGCVAAGVWQWDRHVTRSAAIATIEANLDAPAVPAAELLSATAPPRPEHLWHPVTLTGRYLGDPVLLRNRPVDGQPGFHVLGALEITDGPLSGRVLVVDRGWVRMASDGSAPVAVPAPPQGELSVVARVRAAERASDRAAPAGQVQAIAVAQVRDVLLRDAPDSGDAWPGSATLPAYGVVATEDGAPPVGLAPLPDPSTDPGPHLSYAFQWWVFALGALVGGAVLVARDVRDEGAAQDDGGTVRPGPGPAREGRSRRPTAEEEEDALLDAQSAAAPVRRG